MSSMNPNSPITVGRRTVLQGMTALAGLGLIAGTVPAAFADQPDASADFTAVSKALTARSDLASPLQKALYLAFKAQDGSFDAKLARLATLMGTGDVDNLKTLLTGPNADLAAMPGEILTGWYLGIVGKGKHSVCVAYASDLSNKLVADVLHPQSYAYGAYGSWARKPV
ncbi:hypothetical protein ACELLULO517_04290 [Acidisoma cellulosilytica]|uniref:D-sorbitol dehydrogenase-like protein n=1 Tax=Acidisoma cellulosilyticum TaxID=2802395 RepID=A0A963YYE2_9PROT|nr:sorbitol dehydrogenase family protein [Acidisoma cellulosilyticum]MCB8879441.1 hypothetical protein [Acidisoma cellulosilyticum]